MQQSNAQAAMVMHHHSAHNSISTGDPEEKPMRITLIAAALAGVLSACAGMPSVAPSVTATLAPTRGSNTTGTISFVQTGETVRLTANVAGLPPGAHGFHIHEKGDCSAPDAMSAGGHFNPGAKPHGDPHHGDHHAGDIPALEADSYGNARLTVELSGVSLAEGPNSIIGRGVIVHSAPDDYKTQPTGNSGARLACGVIVRG
jgi:superoxide dismutase, Cu-Zn family